MTKKSFKIELDGKIRYFSLVRVCQGTSVSILSNFHKPRPTKHNGCKANINIILGLGGEFCLINVIFEHTHAFSLKKARCIGCHKRLDEHIKRKLKYNDMVDILLSKNYNS